MGILRKEHLLTETIPYDVITNIAARVGSSSLADLCNLKQSCKMLNELGGDNLVYKQVSMDKFPAIPWRLTPEAIFFLQRCQETGNPEALFRLGMVEYFSKVRLELGRAFLARATFFGHVEASYLLGVILLCTDRNSRIEGMELLKNVERSKKGPNHHQFSECRKRCKMILGEMWVNCCIHLREPICIDSNCNKNAMVQSGGWMEENDKEFNCEVCKCEHEVKLFCKMLHNIM